MTAIDLSGLQMRLYRYIQGIMKRRFPETLVVDRDTVLSRPQRRLKHPVNSVLAGVTAATVVDVQYNQRNWDDRLLDLASSFISLLMGDKRQVLGGGGKARTSNRGKCDQIGPDSKILHPLSVSRPPGANPPKHKFLPRK